LRTPQNYLLTVLTIILLVNYADRLVFGVVLQDIKIDLNLSDTQLGLLGGIAFALFYAVMGIPIGRWADRGNRVSIIAICTALWSAAVALCGAAANFAQLLLIRVGVAVGEAGCYAPSLSLISDYFPRVDRPRAFARYMLGAPLALVIGYFTAGWLNELYGWRATFLLFGLPGLILGPLAWLTLIEPRRLKALAGEAAADAKPSGAVPSPPTLKEVCATLWSNAAFRHLFISFSVWGFFGQGILQWQPAFFVRSHQLATGELGTWFAVVQGVGGLIGTYLGGEAAARYASHDERRQLIGVAVVYALLAVLTAWVYLAPRHEEAFALLAVCSVIAGAANGPLFATLQTLVPPRMRALSVALMYFFCNLIGLGLGPLAVGVLSDIWRPALGEESLRYALLAFCPGYFWCAWHFGRASRTVARDLADAQSEETVAASAVRGIP